MDSQIEQLERLAALHRAGSLTDAEYEAQKARVLSGQTTGFAAHATAPPINEAQLSTTWQRRFAFFRAHGSPLAMEGGTALRKLPFWTASSIRFNVWGFLFGPIYYFALGLWKRGLSMFGVAAVISIVAQRLFGDGVLQLVGIGEATLFALAVNYSYFIKVTESRDEWNPLADLFNQSRSAQPAGDGQR